MAAPWNLNARIALGLLILFGAGGSTFPYADSSEEDGPHRGGTLILHANQELVYTYGLESCGSSDLEDCESATTRSDINGPVVIHVLAVFHETADPRLLGLVFGIDRDPNIELLDWKNCGHREVATPDWPAPGSGTVVTWYWSQDSHLIEVYSFAARPYGGSGQLRLAAHPVQGAYFADDATPVRLDPISRLGAFGFGMDGEAPCPEPISRVGACCFRFGTCNIRGEEDCAIENGVFTRDAESCAPNPCTQPGACCFEDGSCRIEDPDSCTGLFRPSGNCTPNSCLQPGACCFGDGGCRVFIEPVCNNAGGIFEGSDTVCAPNPCPQRGACCFDDRSCDRLVERLCTEAEGVFTGEGVECSESPCAEPGACCLSQGECELRLEQNCDELFLGEVSVCEPNVCPQPPTGACCYVDATCVPQTEFNCMNEEGVYQGDEEDCTVGLCPETLGACCVGDECFSVNPIECSTRGGRYIGDDTSCDGIECEFCLVKLVNRRSNAPTPAGPSRPDEGSGECGELFMNSDSSYENAYAWEGPCVVPPDYGAFAERYDGYVHDFICTVVLDLTQVGNQDGQLLDVYLWEGDTVDGFPGSVAGLHCGVDPGSVALWPAVSRHAIPIEACAWASTFWVGYWAAWPGETAGWYVGADLDGTGGVSFTKTAAAAGGTAGWQPVVDSFGPTQALGIGAEVRIGGCSWPVENTTWGKVKHLFRERARGSRRE